MCVCASQLNTVVFSFSSRYSREHDSFIRNGKNSSCGILREGFLEFSSGIFFRSEGPARRLGFALHYITTKNVGSQSIFLFPLPFKSYCVALYDFDGENDGDLKLW